MNTGTPIFTVLNFVSFKNGCACVHRRILDVMLRILSIFDDTSAYFGM